MTAFGYAATLSAYGDAECEAWRQRLVAYLRHNRDCARRRPTARPRPRTRRPPCRHAPCSCRQYPARRPRHTARHTARHVSRPATCHSPPRVTDVHDALSAIDGVRFTTAEASYLTWIDVADAMPDVGMSAAEYFAEARRDHRRDHD